MLLNDGVNCVNCDPFPGLEFDDLNGQRIIELYVSPSWPTLTALTLAVAPPGKVLEERP